MIALIRTLIRRADRALADLDARLYRLRYDADQRARARREMAAIRSWFVCVAVLALSVTTACAPLQTRRAVRRIEDRCSAAYERATTPAEVDAIHARCAAQYEEVRDAR